MAAAARKNGSGEVLNGRQGIYQRGRGLAATAAAAAGLKNKEAQDDVILTPGIADMASPQDFSSFLWQRG